MKIIAAFFIRKEAVDTVLPLFRELVAASRAEELNQEYDLFVDQKDLGHFVIIEEWPDRATLEKHAATEHFQRILPLIAQYQTKDPVIEIFDACF